MAKLSFSRIDLELFAINSLGFHKAALRRMSTLFLGQLLQLFFAGDADLGQMADEVNCLERNEPRVTHFRRSTPTRPMGGWVVFKRHNGTNYYLTLARLSDGDQSINERVRDAYRFDFPYLQGNA